MSRRLTTSRLQLVPYTQDLVTEQHVAWLNDKDLMRYSEQRRYSHTLESQRAYCEFMKYGRQNFWLIRLDGIDIGTISAFRDRNNKTADMGVLIGHRDHRGKGYGLEAWVAVMEFLKEDGCKKVEAGCMRSHGSMMNIMFDSGMGSEGVRPGHFLLEDGSRDGLIMFGRML